MKMAPSLPWTAGLVPSGHRNEGLWRENAGRAGRVTYGPRARRCMWPPLRPVRLCREHASLGVVRPPGLPGLLERREAVRSIGMDVHRDFCEVAIVEGGVTRSGPRVASTPEDLTVFAQSLVPTDQVAMEN